MQAAVAASGRIFALTHNYTGYPLVRRMRQMVRAGELGELRLVQVEYPQDWLTGPTETTGNKQAEWRVDPARSGAGGVARRHRHPRLQPRRLCHRPRGQRAARRSQHVRRRAQARRQRAHPAALRQRRARRAVGEPGRARQRERPEAARLRDQGRPALGAGEPQRVALVAARRHDAHRHPRRPGLGRRGGARHPHARRPPGRLPRRLRQHLFRGRAGHQGGARGQEPPAECDFPTIADGVKGLAFIEAAVESSKANGAWVKLEG